MNVPFAVQDFSELWVRRNNLRFKINDVVSHQDALIRDLGRIIASASDRLAVLQRAADLIRSSGGYRWVGLYDVDSVTRLVKNVVWSGRGTPEYPTFSVSQGLTASAIASRETVNVGDVSVDPRYLTAFGTTKSEIIVPVFDPRHERVVGTIDVESEKPNAFSKDIQTLLEACAELIGVLWH